MLRKILFVLVCLFVSGSAFAGYYQEDFTSDENPGQAGFASSVFVHSISGGYAFISAPFSAPNPPDALEIFAGIDDITFALGAGEQINHARVGALSAYGHCRIVFEGANLAPDGVTPLRKTFDFNPGTINWHVAEVFDTSESDKINPNDPDEHPPVIGVIRKITLLGGESVYDNIEIETTGGNPNPGTVGVLVNPKKINLNSRSGNVRVTILTDANFDALSIDLATVRLGDATTLVNGFGGDVEPDGDGDLLLFFRFQDIGITCGDTSVLFSGRTYTGELVEGIGVIDTLGCP